MLRYFHMQAMRKHTYCHFFYSWYKKTWMHLEVKHNPRLHITCSLIGQLSWNQHFFASRAFLKCKDYVQIMYQSTYSKAWWCLQIRVLCMLPLMPVTLTMNNITWSCALFMLTLPNGLGFVCKTSKRRECSVLDNSSVFTTTEEHWNCSWPQNKWILTKWTVNHTPAIMLIARLATYVHRKCIDNNKQLSRSLSI